MCHLKTIVALAVMTVATAEHFRPQHFGGSGFGGSGFGGSGFGGSGFGGSGFPGYSGGGGYSNGGYNGGGGYSRGAHIPILSYENVNNGDGNYRYSYETGNGIRAHESGAPRATGPEGPAVTAEGAFSYRAPDGQQVSLSYTADENGFHPVGSHLPTPPPIPEAILRSLQFNRQNPSSEGSYNSGRYNNNGGYHY